MHRHFRPLLTLLLAAIVLGQWSFAAAADSPLRVYIRSGPKTHGPGAHDHPRFLAEWVPLLNARGAVATGGNAFPSAAQLDATDVLILHADNAGDIAPPDRANLTTFLARGGGLMVLHAGAVSKDTAWYKALIGGSWKQGTTKWLEAPMHLYFVDRHHPITVDASNWAMDDEIYYDMDMLPGVNVLATAYTPKSIDTGGKGNKEAQARAAEAVATQKAVNIYDHQPQMWTYERTLPTAKQPYRAFVSIPGHHYANFNRPNYRAILLRGIAWAGRRANVDELCLPSELGDALVYPKDGPTKPSEAAAKIQVHPEFDISLVASEPLIQKVINLTWDEKGRLWVCETPEYPNGRRITETEAWQDSGSLRPISPNRRAEDRISVLSDTDGDGIMDAKKVFADDLELITSFVLYQNGVIAATSPDIWFLEDTDRDGVADKRTKLYTGLGIRDTHSVINNLRWGYDGWIYATHGYSRGDVTSPDGSLKFGPDGSGVVRFKPDGSAFEQYSSKNGNTWGLDITWDGQVFWTQPTSGTVFFHTVLPETILSEGKLPGTTSWQGMITNQRSFPAMEWPEQAYVQIDQVGRFTAAAGCAIYEGGAWPEKWNYSYFTAEPTLNIVHHQFVQPDGVSYSVSKEKGREETEFIRSTDLWFRPIDTRIGPDGGLYLIDFYNQAVMHNDTRGPKHGPANAAVRPDRDHYFSRIWKVQHKEAKTLPVLDLDRTDAAGLVAAIHTSPNAHVKKTALRLLQENHATDPRVAELTPVMGSAALARYHAVQAVTTPAGRATVLVDYTNATDDWTRSAIIAGAQKHRPDFLTSALATKDNLALESFVRTLAASVIERNAPRLTQAAAAHPGPLSAGLLDNLVALDNRLPKLDKPTADALRTLIEHPATTPSALPLAAAWNKEGELDKAIARGSSRLLPLLSDPKTPDAYRAASATSLLALARTRSQALTLIGSLLIDPKLPSASQKALLAAVGNLRGTDAAEVLVNTYAKTKDPSVFEIVLQRPEFAVALLTAVERNRIPVIALGSANIDRLRNHPGDRVSSTANRVFGPIRAANQEKEALVAQLLPEVEKPGNIANGRTLFTAACAICHKLGDIGMRDVGPPLAGIGSHGALALLTAIVDPNRSVEPNYWQWDITTKNNQTYSGVMVSETNTSVTLRNQGGDTEIKAADIVTRTNTRRSLMPEGFEGLEASNLRDLVAFMVDSAKAPVVDETPKAGGPRDAPLPPVEPIVWEPGKTRVLMISGGSSHKFGEFFGGTDRATLKAAGFSVNYTEDRDQAAAALASGEADVALISVNRKFFDTPAYRQALMAFAASGKGIIMHHPGTWYGYQDWPELNAQIIGGGARGHDKIAKYDVKTLQPNHPIMKGVPATFTVEDELYYINAEPAKIPANTSPITVLAQTSPSQKFNAPHPVVWITSHPTSRVVGLTIGHDERVHDMKPFKTLLINAVKWASGK